MVTTKKSGHKFINKDDDGTYMICCIKTGGTFSTRLWDLEKVKKGICPCCDREVKE